MPDTTQAVVGWRTSDPPKVDANTGLLIVSGDFHGEAYYDDDPEQEGWRWACGAPVSGDVDMWMPIPTREDAGVMAALYDALVAVERHCPCGARPESPNTHPHVIGCPVDLALRKARG